MEGLAEYCQRLKDCIIKSLLGNTTIVDEPYINIMKNGVHQSFTRRELAEEISRDTEIGIKTLTESVILAMKYI